MHIGVYFNQYSGKGKVILLFSLSFPMQKIPRDVISLILKGDIKY